MLKLESDRTVFFDVDDTLVMWGHENHPDAVTFKDEFDPNPRSVYSLVPHTRHIEVLKRDHNDGYKVIVWSQAGWQWASTVVEKLELEQYVDIVMTKPDVYYDDIPAGEFMQRRYFKTRLYEGGDK